MCFSIGEGMDGEGMPVWSAALQGIHYCHCSFVVHGGKLKKKGPSAKGFASTKLPSPKKLLYFVLLHGISLPNTGGNLVVLGLAFFCKAL